MIKFQYYLKINVNLFNLEPASISQMPHKLTNVNVQTTPSTSEWVMLNVGGKIFTTTRLDLLSTEIVMKP